MQDTVNLPLYGRIKCSKVQKPFSSSSKQVYQYLGIPFAQPPVGVLRFLPPKE